MQSMDPLCYNNNDKIVLISLYSFKSTKQYKARRAQ